MERGFLSQKGGGVGRGVKEKQSSLADKSAVISKHVHGNHFPASVNEEDNVNAGTVNKDANTVDDVGKDSDGLNSSPTKVTRVNSVVNKEGNMHDENDGVTPSKSTANPNKGNEDNVVVLVEYVRVISERFANTIYCFFLGKRVAYTIVANYVKLHGVPVTGFSEDGLSVIATKLGTPLMLNSYTYDMCIQSWGKSRYVRALIEVRSDVELKDNIMMAMPKLVEEGFYTCNDECPKNIDSDVVKNIKKPRQTPRGVMVSPKVEFKLVKQVYRQVSKNNTVNTRGNKKKDVEPKIEYILNEKGGPKEDECIMSNQSQGVSVWEGAEEYSLTDRGGRAGVNEIIGGCVDI
nr:hypothetical protein [Tanacetum cinerariifolium]GEX51935.1 hypothetical protein [Tanacetum cinerariifolium]